VGVLVWLRNWSAPRAMVDDGDWLKGTASMRILARDYDGLLCGLCSPSVCVIRALGTLF